jgi:hypothetical protein
MNDEAEVPDAVREQFEADTLPGIINFAATALQTAQTVAEAEGWYPEEARWLAEHALQPLTEALETGVDPEAALMGALRDARLMLAIHAFDEALATGSSRDVAFLTLVETEARVARHGGGAAPAYSDALLRAACAAVATAASEGASTREQIGTGFAVMRTLVAEGAA